MINLGLILKKYSVPTLFFILGISLVIVGFNSEQTLTFKISSLLICIVALISFFNVSGVFPTLMTKVVGLCAFLVASIVLYLTYSIVSETMEYQTNYNNCKELSRRNLSDLRTAQKAYFDRYKKYAGDWETIIKFIETDSINIVISEGSVPSRKITESERNFLYRDNRPIDENMNEEEAYKLSKSRNCPPDLLDFKRDSVKTSFIKTAFTENKSYLKERADNKFLPFDVSTLKFIPFTNNKQQWSLTTNKILIGADSVSTIRVEGAIPFSKIKGQKKKELIYFGRLELNDLSGSWEEE